MVTNSIEKDAALIFERISVGIAKTSQKGTFGDPLAIPGPIQLIWPTELGSPIHHKSFHGNFNSTFIVGSNRTNCESFHHRFMIAIGPSNFFEEYISVTTVVRPIISVA